MVGLLDMKWVEASGEAVAEGFVPEGFVPEGFVPDPRMVLENEARKPKPKDARRVVPARCPVAAEVFVAVVVCSRGISGAGCVGACSTADPLSDSEVDSGSLSGADILWLGDPGVDSEGELSAEAAGFFWTDLEGARTEAVLSDMCEETAVEGGRDQKRQWREQMGQKKV